MLAVERVRAGGVETRATDATLMQFFKPSTSDGVAWSHKAEYNSLQCNVLIFRLETYQGRQGQVIKHESCWLEAGGSVALLILQHKQ